MVGCEGYKEDVYWSYESGFLFYNDEVCLFVWYVN